MKIGIIGAGHIGGTLARRLVAVGHEVKIANSRGPQTLGDLARESGAKAVTVADAVKDVGLIIVTIPEKNIPVLGRSVFEHVPADVVIVDTGNYYPRERDGRIAAIEDGMPESVWMSGQIGRPVIKVFNNIYAQHLLENGKPHGAAGRIALPVAGDDASAKKQVMALVDQLGFDPVDAGSLAESWRQQPGSPVYCGDFDAAGVRKALAEASPERTEAFKAQA
ncbi:NAD(P)-binding domain-containing protein [Acetobacter cerevisiae]|uniref:NAD(P)-binding domain-containing protein n=1 Tax=Acetobacter cerevisiae TaxID=178900 RepID=A0ABT1ERX7_9PROT|nr:NAD(P)-binding domain-containing protein [Acetobacter cerevisiae]MCP1246122.1 NAD(P)-binding domain-containing protein [Acetobacter cerevisiae]MCP1255594.1 NAD(P)-binding domain-containing protein [Acetobacter cerevisiae]